MKESSPPLPVTRLEVRLPEGHFLSQYRQPFAISPDGKLVVFSAFTSKSPFEEPIPLSSSWNPFDSFEARPIPGTEGGIQPVFSPDGQQVALSSRLREAAFLKRIPVAGGQVSTICQCRALFGIAWSSQGTILLGSIDGLEEGTGHRG